MKNQTKEYLIISILPLMMLIFSFLVNTPTEIFDGMKLIFSSNNILITDYFFISNLGATFFNASITSLMCIILIYRLNLRLNGLLITSIFLIISFSFMGKNLLNILPFYIGIILHSKYMKKSMKSLIAIGIMSTSLAPISNILFPYGFIFAIIIAFFMPSITQNTLTIHGGYNLYNAGYSGGIVGIVIYSILISFGIEFDKNVKFINKIDKSVFIFFLIYFIILIIISIIFDKNILKNFISIQLHTGRLVTDFVTNEGFYASLFNMAVMGLICLFVAYIYGILNGVIICSMLTVVGFGGFGKHIRNILPLMLGVFIAQYIFKIKIDKSLYLMVMFFSTALAPISGKYGIISGVASGILHYAVAINISSVHGGLNLYNNGLAAGLVASLMVPILTMIKEK